jgi:ribosomal protein S12 methylthiotransferase
MKKIRIETLGCDKNLVDSEALAGRLTEKYEISPDFENGEAVIINTCGFIGDAKKQSIEAILTAVEQKKSGNFKKVLLTGCLIERYYDELKAEIKEVDGFFRLGDFDGIANLLGIKNSAPGNIYCNRVALEYNHIAYIKISDGCDHKCSYCAIPGIRGKYRSRSIDSILEETEVLLSGSVKEIILVGQEISSFGKDLGIKNGISDLLRELSAMCGRDRWIRLLYTHPPLVKKEFAETIAGYENICNYIDFPVQHTQTEILKAMGRGDTTEKLADKLKMMRDIIPGIAVRTSIITGFPGESRKIFNAMKKDLEKFRFDRLGAFPFSLEEGTKAALMDDKVSSATAIKRTAELLRLQSEISLENNLNLVGKVEKVLIDRHEDGKSIGRTYRDAPDVDNEVIIDKKLKIGEFYDAEITGAEEYDLYAKVKV